MCLIPLIPPKQRILPDYWYRCDFRGTKSLFFSRFYDLFGTWCLGCLSFFQKTFLFWKYSKHINIFLLLKVHDKGASSITTSVLTWPHKNVLDAIELAKYKSILPQPLLVLQVALLVLVLFCAFLSVLQVFSWWQKKLIIHKKNVRQ